MKRILIFYSCFFLIIHLSNGQDKSQEGFVLVRDEPPVFIYQRWIVFPDSKPAQDAREVKCVFIIHGNIYDFLPLLKVEANVRVWQTHVSKFKYYPQPDTTFWLEYSYHDIPWPVSDQDHFLEYHISEPKPGKELLITFKSRSDQKLAPLNKGVTRMILVGSWKAEQLPGDQVQITYRILSMPIGIPRLFTDPVIRNNLMSTIHALMELSKSPHP
jgi:hypothetical protein